jgi:hypothetical protein
MGSSHSVGNRSQAIGSRSGKKTRTASGDFYFVQADDPDTAGLFLASPCGGLAPTVERRMKPACRIIRLRVVKPGGPCAKQPD